MCVVPLSKWLAQLYRDSHHFKCRVAKIKVSLSCCTSDIVFFGRKRAIWFIETLPKQLTISVSCSKNSRNSVLYHFTVTGSQKSWSINTSPGSGPSFWDSAIFLTASFQQMSPLGELDISPPHSPNYLVWLSGRLGDGGEEFGDEAYSEVLNHVRLQAWLC